MSHKIVATGGFVLAATLMVTGCSGNKLKEAESSTPSTTKSAQASDSGLDMGSSRSDNATAAASITAPGANLTMGQPGNRELH